MSHAEDMEISPWDYRLAEDIETVRNCWLSEYYQTSCTCATCPPGARRPSRWQSCGAPSPAR
ncbi:MAG: hypothetical protein ACLUIR_04140 [Faecalibacterium prausnitzii]